MVASQLLSAGARFTHRPLVGHGVFNTFVVEFDIDNGSVDVVVALLRHLDDLALSFGRHHDLMLVE